MDKLAMEEAGFRNCVSVPDGAPPSVSSKELPPADKVFFMLNMLDTHLYKFKFNNIFLFFTYTSFNYTVICCAMLKSDALVIMIIL